MEEKHGETVMEFISSIAAVFVSGLFIITFILQAFEIPSRSMVKTLLVGDHVFVNRIGLAPKTRWTGPVIPYRQIHRGDIIVFLSPAQPGLYLVKRVRGIPGDHLHLRDGRLFVNGQLQDEPFVVRDGSYSPYRDNFPAVPPTEMDGITPEWRLTLNSHVQGEDLVVPAGRYFAMGDNRDISYDSRYWGFVPGENVIGSPMFIYWSFITPEEEYPDTNIAHRAGYMLDVVFHFFDKTRWSRTFKIIR